MQLKCKHCTHISKSLLIVKDDALAEVITDFVKHLTTQHNKKNDANSPFNQFVQDGSMLAAVGPTIILIAKHTTLLDEELEIDDYIQEKFSKLIDQLEEFLGVEVFDNKPNEVRLYTKEIPGISNPAYPSRGEHPLDGDPDGTDLTLPYMS